VVTTTDVLRLQKKQLQKTVCGYDCKKIEKQLKKQVKVRLQKPSSKSSMP
jgi:hypothetical protein